MNSILNDVRAGVQDILDYGLYGWALSRYSGCWVALKCVHDTVEATASIDISPARVILGRGVSRWHSFDIGPGVR